MIVGVMQNNIKPSKLVKLTALICRSYGIELVYLRPKDVNIKTGRVRGKVLKKNEWHEKVMDVPSFIDISPKCFKDNREVTDYLKKVTFLSDNRENVIRKIELQEHLANDKNYSNLVIPTFKDIDYGELQRKIDKYTKIVLKPARGARGKGVYLLEKSGESFILGHKTQDKKLNKEELCNFFNEEIAPNNYALQKYVSSRTLQGVRLIVEYMLKKMVKGNGRALKTILE